MSETDIQPIPFVNRQESGFSSLAGGSPVAMNVVVDGKGAVRRRPCLTTYDSVQSTVIDANGIDGIYVTNGGRIIATSPTPSHHKIYNVAAVASELSSGSGGYLAGSARPTFAETEALLVMAAGQQMQKLVLATMEASLLGGSPPRATHVDANAERLLCNDLDNPSRVAYSDTASGSSFAGHELWDSSISDAGFISAEARPDPVVAVVENTNEVFAFGTTNVQVFDPDAQSVYAPVSTREYGLGAPYSIVKRDQEFYFLDHKQRFIKTDGRMFQEFGQPVQKTINDMGFTADAFGYWCRVGFLDALCWCFPTDGRTFVFQPDSGWGIWMGNSGNQQSRLLVNSYFSIAGTAIDVVGTTDGRVGRMSFDVQEDFGQRVTAYIETGAIDRGSARQKHCVSVRLTLTAGAGVTGQVGFLSWRDDENSWGDPEAIVLDGSPVVLLRSLGVYRKRWWRFEFSGSQAVILAKAEEEFQLLGS